MKWNLFKKTREGEKAFSQMVDAVVEEACKRVQDRLDKAINVEYQNIKKTQENLDKMQQEIKKELVEWRSIIVNDVSKPQKQS